MNLEESMNFSKVFRSFIIEPSKRFELFITKKHIINFSNRFINQYIFVYYRANKLNLPKNVMENLLKIKNKEGGM